MSLNTNVPYENVSFCLSRGKTAERNIFEKTFLNHESRMERKAKKRRKDFFLNETFLKKRDILEKKDVFRKKETFLKIHF